MRDKKIWDIYKKDDYYIHVYITSTNVTTNSSLSDNSKDF